MSALTGGGATATAAGASRTGDFRGILESRWSCRAYLDTPVPDADIETMFSLAQQTASWCNTQPWHAHVTSGEATRRFAKHLVEHARAAAPSADLPVPGEYVGVYRDRRREAGFKLYESMGISREDLGAREAQHLRNFEFFGAPHVAVITTDRNQGVYGAVDCGAYVANLLNAATSLGIATIPQAAIAMHSGAVREFLEIPDDRLIVCAVSFGYADTEHPINTFRTSRGRIEDAVTRLED